VSDRWSIRLFPRTRQAFCTLTAHLLGDGQAPALREAGSTASGREVRAHDLVPLGQGPTHETTELLERGVRDPVASEQAVPPARHEALLEEQRQVLARIGLGRIGQRAQLLNRALLAERG
jgi:hypothetical protein